MPSPVRRKWWDCKPVSHDPKLAITLPVCFLWFIRPSEGAQQWLWGLPLQSRASGSHTALSIDEIYMMISKSILTNLERVQAKKCESNAWFFCGYLDCIQYRMQEDNGLSTWCYLLMTFLKCPPLIVPFWQACWCKWFPEICSQSVGCD